MNRAKAGMAPPPPADAANQAYDRQERPIMVFVTHKRPTKAHPLSIGTKMKALGVLLS